MADRKKKEKEEEAVSEQPKRVMEAAAVMLSAAAKGMESVESMNTLQDRLRAYSENFGLQYIPDAERFTSDPNYVVNVVKDVEASRETAETLRLAEIEVKFDDALYKKFLEDAGKITSSVTPKAENLYDDLEKALRSAKETIETKEKELKEKEETLDKTSADYQVKLKKLGAERRRLKSERDSLRYSARAISKQPDLDFPTIAVIKILANYKAMNGAVSEVVREAENIVYTAQRRLKTALSWAEFFRDRGLNAMYDLWRNHPDTSGFSYMDIERAIAELSGFEYEKVTEQANESRDAVIKLAQKLLPNPEPVIGLANNYDFRALIRDLDHTEKVVIKPEAGNERRAIKFSKKHGVHPLVLSGRIQEIIEAAKKASYFAGAILPKDEFATALRGRYWKQRTFREDVNALFSTQLLEPIRKVLVDEEILTDEKSLKDLTAKPNHRTSVNYIPQTVTINGRPNPIPYPKEGSSSFDIYELKESKTPAGTVKNPTYIAEMVPLKDLDEAVHYLALYRELQKTAARYQKIKAEVKRVGA